MKNLAFHSLLRWKMITLPILATSLIHFSLWGWENVLFNLGVIEPMFVWFFFCQKSTAGTETWRYRTTSAGAGSCAAASWCVKTASLPCSSAQESRPSRRNATARSSGCSIGRASAAKWAGGARVRGMAVGLGHLVIYSIHSSSFIHLSSIQFILPSVHPLIHLSIPHSSICQFISFIHTSITNPPIHSFAPRSVAGHVPTLPWVRSRVWLRVRLGAGLASGRGG